jgi:hypothetical protein
VDGRCGCFWPFVLLCPADKVVLLVKRASFDSDMGKLGVDPHLCVIPLSPCKFTSMYVPSHAESGLKKCYLPPKIPLPKNTSSRDPQESSRINFRHTDRNTTYVRFVIRSAHCHSSSPASGLNDCGQIGPPIAPMLSPCLFRAIARPRATAALKSSPLLRFPPQYRARPPARLFAASSRYLNQKPQDDKAATPEKTKNGNGPEPVAPPKDLLAEVTQTAQGQRQADWGIIKEMSRYLWPKVSAQSCAGRKPDIRMSRC